MNIGYETMATLYGAAAITSWIVLISCGITITNSVQTIVRKWMRKTNKLYFYEVWFDRCVLVYGFLLVFTINGFDLFAKLLAGFIIFHSLIDNPWMIRHIEQIRAGKERKTIK